MTDDLLRQALQTAAGYPCVQIAARLPGALVSKAMTSWSRAQGLAMHHGHKLNAFPCACDAAIKGKMNR